MLEMCSRNMLSMASRVNSSTTNSLKPLRSCRACDMARGVVATNWKFSVPASPSGPIVQLNQPLQLKGSGRSAASNSFHVRKSFVSRDRSSARIRRLKPQAPCPAIVRLARRRKGPGPEALKLCNFFHHHQSTKHHQPICCRAWLGRWNLMFCHSVCEQMPQAASAVPNSTPNRNPGIQSFRQTRQCHT
jgi:hypothetical protein